MNKSKTLGDHPSTDDRYIIPSENNNFNNTIGVPNDIFKVTTHNATSFPNDEVCLGEATPRALLNAIKYKQEGVMQDIQEEDDKKRNKIIKLLKILIDNDHKLSPEEKTRAKKCVDEEVDEYGNSFIINRWLGRKLNKHERRLLRVLRRLAYPHVLSEYNRLGKSSFSYNLELTMSEIYEKWGLTRRNIQNGDGYDYNQTKIIKELLFSDNDLHENMLFKRKYITKTRYILQAEEIYSDVKKTEQKQIYGVKLTLPEFLFICNEDLENGGNAEGYINQDTAGFGRFMKSKGMEQNHSAFSLAEYLEESLYHDKKIRFFDVKTMVRETELKELYNTRPARAVDRINKLLDRMKEVGFLISDWKLDKKGGKYKQGQYELHNSRVKKTNPKK